MQKVNWDYYFLSLAYLVSIKSPDINTKHGCVFVDSKNRVLSMGYNGYLAEIDDEKVPKTRPEKYSYTLHSEENAILFCQSSLEGATAYITGYPCEVCARMMLQKGIRNFIVGPYVSACIDDNEKEAIDFMMKQKEANIKIYSCDDIRENIFTLYDLSKNIFEEKVKGQ